LDVLEAEVFGFGGTIFGLGFSSSSEEANKSISSSDPGFSSFFSCWESTEDSSTFYQGYNYRLQYSLRENFFVEIL